VPIRANLFLERRRRTHLAAGGGWRTGKMGHRTHHHKEFWPSSNEDGIHERASTKVTFGFGLFFLRKKEKGGGEHKRFKPLEKL